MPKDDRKILNAVRGDNKGLFKDGMEDELAAAASQERLDQLRRDGVISGTWTSTKRASEMTVSGDAPSEELSDRAEAEGIEISNASETADFKPLSVKETVKRMNEFDFSEDVTRSMSFHGDAIKEEILKQKQAAEAKSEKGKTGSEKTSDKTNAADDGKPTGDGQVPPTGTGNNPPSDDDNDDADEFPAKFPGRAKFIKAGKTLAEIKTFNREQLIEVDGIADTTADEVLAYFKA